MNGLRNTCCSTVMRLWISRTTENQGKLLIRHEKINKYINLFFFCQESLFIMFTCCRGFNRLNSFPVFNKNDSTRILHLTKGPEWRCSEGSGGSYALPLNHMLKTLILPYPPLYLPSVFNSLFSLRNFLKLFKSTSSVEGLTGYFARPLKIPTLELFLPFSYSSTREIPILLKYL